MRKTVADLAAAPERYGQLSINDGKLVTAR